MKTFNALNKAQIKETIIAYSRVRSEVPKW